jgi:hypothetical protein
MQGEIEPQIFRVEQGLRLLAARLRNIEDQAADVGQKTVEVWSLIGSAPSTACTGNFIVTVHDDTFGLLAGATVTAVQGATTVTGTANGSGVATLAFTAAGSWTITASGACRNNASTAVPAVCGSNTTVSLTPTRIAQGTGASFHIAISDGVSSGPFSTILSSADGKSTWTTLGALCGVPPYRLIGGGPTCILGAVLPICADAADVTYTLSFPDAVGNWLLLQRFDYCVASGTSASPAAQSVVSAGFASGRLVGSTAFSLCSPIGLTFTFSDPDFFVSPVSVGP